MKIRLGQSVMGFYENNSDKQILVKRQKTSMPIKLHKHDCSEMEFYEFLVTDDAVEKIKSVVTKTEILNSQILIIYVYLLRYAEI